MSEEPLIVVDDGPIRHLILNRPEKLNAIDQMQHIRLISEFVSAETDLDVELLTLSGVGRGFCSGDDLTASPLPDPDPFEDRKVDLDLGSGPIILLKACDLLRKLRIPTVAVMHGVALGSGYDYSLSCDFRVVTKSVRYGDPRIDRALWAAEGWSYKLPRLTNYSLVSRIAYLGEIMNGQTAYNYGLAHMVVPDTEQILDAAQPLFKRLVGQSSYAYSITKSRINGEMDGSFLTAVNMGQ